MSSNGGVRFVWRGGSNSKASVHCEVYPSAQTRDNLNNRNFSESGEDVVIGDNVRIGAMCFIPEGVTIEEGAWVGPRVTFSNDMFPPSGRDQWKKTLVKKGARLGAGVCVRP